MINDITCDNCNKIITCYRDMTLDHGRQKEYVCSCGEFYTITISRASDMGKKNRKAQSCGDDCGDYSPYKRFEDREEHNRVVAVIARLVGKGLDGYESETVLYINHLIGDLQR